MPQFFEQRVILLLQIGEPLFFGGYLLQPIHQLFAAGLIVKIFRFQPADKIAIDLIVDRKGSHRRNLLMATSEFGSVVEMVKVIQDAVGNVAVPYRLGGDVGINTAAVVYPPAVMGIKFRYKRIGNADRAAVQSAVGGIKRAEAR